MKMNVLFLSQGYKIEDHPGWHWALEQLQREGMISAFLNIPVRGYVEKYGWNAFYDHVEKLCNKTEFDVVYFHYFHHRHTQNVISPEKCILKIRSMLPQVIILASAGDGFSVNWLRPHYPFEFKEVSRCADITYSTQMGGAVDAMTNWGAKNIVYTPNSSCPVRFKSKHINIGQHRFEFDVVFVGSNNVGRMWNPLSRDLYESRARLKLVKELHGHFGNRFGLFGNNWDGVLFNHGVTPFSEQHNTFQRGRIVVGGNPYSLCDYYSSNRLFFEISSGVPTVELAVPRLDHVLRNQDHCYFCNSIDEIIETCDRLLKVDPEELYTLAANAADYIAERHTQYHRMKFKLETAVRYRENGNKLDVKFPFFLPEVDIDHEMKYAVRQ